MEAFGDKQTTPKRLCGGTTNRSDLGGARRLCPRGWFLVPLAAIDEAVKRIKDGSIAEFVYDPGRAQLIRACTPAP